MLKLYVKQNGQFIQVSALAIGAHLKAIKKVTIKDAVAEYDKTCTSHKCIKNQNSERLYFGKLKKFLDEKKIEWVDEITKHHIQDFESILLKQMKVSSVNRRFNTIKHFFVKCKEWQFTHENPCDGMEKRKEETNPHKPWPIDLFTQFLLLTTGVHTDLFYFLWLTGCRPMEAKNLRWTDIDQDNGVMTFRCGKNAKVSRQFPITHEISRLLHNMRIDSLFVFSENRKQIDNSILYHYCKDRLKVITTGKYTVYGIRHTFATELSKAGANAFDIADLMGHTKIETTRRYVHNDREKILKILNDVK